MTSPDPTNNLQRVEFRLSEGQIRRVDQIAHELSEPGPGGRVTRADVLREAVAVFDIDPTEESLTEGKIGDNSDGGVEA